LSSIILATSRKGVVAVQQAGLGVITDETFMAPLLWGLEPPAWKTRGFHGVTAP
jgi:hypothetical protein